MQLTAAAKPPFVAYAHNEINMALNAYFVPVANTLLASVKMNAADKFEFYVSSIPLKQNTEAGGLGNVSGGMMCDGTVCKIKCKTVNSDLYLTGMTLL